MGFTRESLNSAVSAKLADCNSAAIYHQGLFGITQIAGIAGLAGSLLIAPLAVEVSIITGIAGLTFYGISQLIQTKRTGHFLPLPAVPISVAQLGYLPARLLSQLMDAAPPPAPEEVRLLPADWLPQRERRISYLLTHAPDILIAAAENAQEGISFAAIVDTAVRASELAITDQQIQNPVAANKLRGDVRALLSGDTSRLEAQQQKALAAEWSRAQSDHEAGVIDEQELKAIEAEVTAIAPNVVNTQTNLQQASSNSAIAPSEKAITQQSLSAYAVIVASPYRSRFFLGGQRTGKSYLAVASARNASEKGADVYYLNLSRWGTEDDSYSSIALKAVMSNIHALTTEQAAEMLEAARRLLQSFFISDHPAILVLEEWCELGSKHHQHKTLLEPLLRYSASIVEQLANTGQKRRKAVYATGPMFVAGSLQQATKAAKSMALILVAISPGKTVYWREQALTFDPAVFSMAVSNWHGVSEPPGDIESDRIAFVDGQWRAVGEIPTASVTTTAQRGQTTKTSLTPVKISAEAAPTEPSQWEIGVDKLRAANSPYLPFAIWVEGRDGKPFTLGLAKDNRQLREAMPDECPGSSQRERVTNAFNALKQWGLISTTDGNNYTAV